MAKKIFIDPGHSISDPGAVGYEVERDLNEKVAKFTNEHLLANYVCETKVDPVTNKSLSAVADHANEWKADFLLSIHFNAGGGDGFEALVYGENTVPMGKVFEKYVLAIGQNSRGVKLRPDLAVLRQSAMPAVLCEGAFVDNKKDIEDWNDDAELKKLGEAYAKAVAEVMNLEQIIKAELTPAPVPEPAPAPKGSLYRVFDAAGKQVGAYSYEENAINEAKKQLHAGGATKITLSDK